MSLVSASKLVGGLKEYGYRGFQQLPLVLGSTSMLFTIATGSRAHAAIVLGMGVFMPVYTYLMQMVVGKTMPLLFPKSIFWRRISSDSCNIIPEFNNTTGGLALSQFKSPEMDESLPSYWLMAIAFFIGYSISNAVDSLLTPGEPGANEMNREKRNHQAGIVITTCIIFAVFILAGRFYFMPGCEGIQSGAGILGIALAILGIVLVAVLAVLPTIITGAIVALIILPIIAAYRMMGQESEYFKGAGAALFGSLGLFLSLLSATGAAGIGYGTYYASKQCGARSSDLFGILSQILPPSATGPRPVVCTAQSS
jgi:hypothetical protein